MMTSLREIIRPSDSESEQYRRACAISMGEYIKGEACGVGAVDLLNTLDFGLFMAAHHDPFAKYPSWARGMALGVRRALRRTWDVEEARREATKADAAAIALAVEVGDQVNAALDRRYEWFAAEMYEDPKGGA